MFDPLVDFVNYSDFSSRVRRCEKQLKSKSDFSKTNQLSKTEIVEEQEIFFRKVISCEHIISRLCALCENSTSFLEFISQKRDEISEICVQAFTKSPDSTHGDILHLLKLIGYLHHDGIISKSDELLNQIFKALTTTWLPPQTALISGNTAVTIMLKKSKLDPNCFHQDFENALNSSSLEVFELSLLTGYMSVVPLKILLHPRTQTASCTKTEIEEKRELVEEKRGLVYYLQNMIQRCQQSSPLTFQHFYLLKLFSTKIKDGADYIESLGVCNTNHDETSSSQDTIMLTSADIYQQHQPLLTKDEVDQILSLCVGNVENQTRGVPDLCSDIYRNIVLSCQLNWTQDEFTSLLNGLVLNTQKSKWTHKSKYFQLQILVPVLGVKRSEETFCDLEEGLPISLSTMHIIHAGVEIYKYFLLDESIWQKLFSNVLVEKLLSTNSLIRQNTRDYWLPATLKNIPESTELIQNKLENSQGAEELKILSQLDILKLCRQIGSLNQLSPQQWNTLNKGLVHSNCDVRSAAFSIICEVKKKGRPPTKQEMDIVIDFLDANSIEDNTRFRQCVLSKFGILMIRCRDFCTLGVRKITKDPELLDVVIEVATFLDKILKLVLNNLQPGGNYQRKISSFLLLNIFIDNFVEFKMTGANKCSGNGDPKEFLDLVHTKDLMVFYSRSAFKAFLLNIEDKMGDVRDAAGQLLRMFTPSEKDINQIYERGMKLIQSARDRECESGATLLQLTAFWKSKHENMDGSRIWLRLLEKYEVMVRNQGNGDFFQAILLNAQHGTFTGMRKLLLDESSPEYLKLDQMELDRLTSVLQQSVHFMLSVLSGESEDNGVKNPSFEESAKAINKVIQESGISVDDETTIPESYKLVLSAVWHNIKGAALLAGDIVRCFPFALEPQAADNSLSPGMVQQYGNLLVKILTLCRHKGAQEGTVTACSAFASRLVNADIAHFSKIPCKLIEEALDFISKSGDSSVTRRSAGLPGLIQTLLAADCSGSLVNSTISSLLAMAKTEENLDQVKDTKVCHALHILGGIVQNAAVSKHVASHIHNIMVTCVKAFESKSWSERNAALQLFGALAPRVLGQKKLRSNADYEKVDHNRVSLLETNIRFPGLLSLFIEKLKPRESSNVLVSAATVPILTLLASLESSPTGSSSKQEDLDLEMMIWHGVDPYLSSPVIQVRQLASKVYAEFSPFTVKDILGQTSKIAGQTNLLHSYLQILLLKIKSDVNNSNNLDEQTTQDNRDFENLLKTELSAVSQNTECFIIKTNIIEILDLIGEKLDYDNINTVINRSSPGFDQYQERINLQARTESRNLQEELRSLDGEVINEALVALNNKEHIEDSQVEEFVELTSNLLSSSCPRLLINSLTFLNSAQVTENLNKNPETALDLLESLKTSPEVASLSITLHKVQLKAACLNALMIQDDWAWFFGDTSEYVSIYVECSENIYNLGQAHQLEDSRLTACRSLLSLVPSFNIRNIKGRMTPILQYGVVNCLNAALILLQDEDVEVRNAATRFSSQLKRSTLLPQDCEISTFLGIQSVVFFGLDQLSDVIEMFTPVTSLINIPALPSLAQTSEEKQLFKKGDGINVYEEPIFMLLTYHQCIRLYCEENHLNLTSLDVDNVIQHLEDLFATLVEDKRLYDDAYFQTSVYEYYKRLELLLNICQQSNVLKTEVDSSKKEKLCEFREKVKKSFNR